MIFIARELNKGTTKNIRFKSMLARLETEVSNAGSVKSEGTKTKDDTHFDSEGLKIRGKSMCRKINFYYELKIKAQLDLFLKK